MKNTVENPNHFIFIASPLKMRGATASPIRPLAIPIRRNY
jgi:kynurenine formamidase